MKKYIVLIIIIGVMDLVFLGSCSRKSKPPAKQLNELLKEHPALLEKDSIITYDSVVVPKVSLEVPVLSLPPRSVLYDLVIPIQNTATKKAVVDNIQKYLRKHVKDTTITDQDLTLKVKIDTLGNISATAERAKRTEVKEKKVINQKYQVDTSVPFYKEPIFWSLIFGLILCLYLLYINNKPKNEF